MAAHNCTQHTAHPLRIYIYIYEVQTFAQFFQFHCLEWTIRVCRRRATQPIAPIPDSLCHVSCFVCTQQRHTHIQKCILTPKSSDLSIYIWHNTTRVLLSIYIYRYMRVSWVAIMYSGWASVISWRPTVQKPEPRTDETEWYQMSGGWLTYIMYIHAAHTCTVHTHGAARSRVYICIVYTSAFGIYCS